MVLKDPEKPEWSQIPENISSSFSERGERCNDSGIGPDDQSCPGTTSQTEKMIVFGLRRYHE
jgi:hypothetical protein